MSIILKTLILMYISTQVWHLKSQNMLSIVLNPLVVLLLNTNKFSMFFQSSNHTTQLICTTLIIIDLIDLKK